MGRILVYLVLGGTLAVSVWAAWYMWNSVETEMPPAGWIALIAGIVVSLALAGVLMGILFYSSRSGHDEEVDRSSRAKNPDEHR